MFHSPFILICSCICQQHLGDERKSSVYIPDVPGLPLAYLLLLAVAIAFPRKFLKENSDLTHKIAGPYLLAAI